MISIGIDLIDVNQFEVLLTSPDFLTSCFCEMEIAMFKTIGRITFLAGRYAAKNAIIKALGKKCSEDVALSDIEIGLLPSGAPVVLLRNRADQLAKSKRISNWSISISHTEALAVAIAVAERG